MEKVKKISHSAWGKYLTCGKLYDLHYNHRLRPKGTSSALVFGTAIDEALNVLLLKKDLGLAIEAFRDNFEWQKMNEVSFDDRDADYSLVEPAKFKDPKEHAWACMRVKGRMLLEAYYEQIYPLIEEVYDVQRELFHRPGVLDNVVKLRGYGRVLLDNKTSARPYQPDAVAVSTQLAVYAKDQGIKKAGFAVLVKQIQKNVKRTCTTCGFDGSRVRHKTCPEIVNGSRCYGVWDECYNPKAQVQLMVENVSDHVSQLVESSMSEAERGIEAGIYPRNLNACGKMWGKPCPYIDYCWKGKKDGLEIVPERKKLTTKSNNDTVIQYTEQDVDKFFKDNKGLMDDLSKEKK